MDGITNNVIVNNTLDFNNEGIYLEEFSESNLIWGNNLINNSAYQNLFRYYVNWKPMGF